MSTVKMRMSICLKGLRKPRFWRKNLKGLFSLGGRDMTDAEVRKVVDYGISKGYDTEQDIPVDEIIALLEWGAIETTNK